MHQFLPTLGYLDAVGNHTLETRRALREAGFRGAIWAENIDPQMRGYARYFERYGRVRSAKRAGNLLMYSTSTGSDRLADYVISRPEVLTLRYHNITPPEFFEPYLPAAADNLSRGREQLRLMAPRVRVAMADSKFNARELTKLGIPDVRVIPPYLPRAATPPNPALSAELMAAKRGLHLLFVGRVAPNKGHARLLEVFSALRAAVDPYARLFIIGAWGPRAYMRELFELRDLLGLGNHVQFTDSVPQQDLAAYYAAADFYVSMSRHEGFGLPLVEAMRSRVVIVAHEAGAVAETLGGAGVLIRELDVPTVAELIGKIAENTYLREEILAQQSKRLAELDAIPRDRLVVKAIRDAWRSTQ